MQVTNHSNNKRNMKEELLEAIYGTVERLEQKVDELSASPKNTEAESTPVSVSVNISKLEQAILAMAVKEGESIDKLARLREAICIFTDLTKKEASNGEQRSKLLFDAINQVKQELNATSKMCRKNFTQWVIHLKKRLSPIVSSQLQSMFFFSLVAWLYPL